MTKRRTTPVAVSGFIRFALELLVLVIEISPSSWGFREEGRSALSEVLRIVTEENQVARDDSGKYGSLYPMSRAPCGIHRGRNSGRDVLVFAIKYMSSKTQQLNRNRS